MVLLQPMIALLLQVAVWLPPVLGSVSLDAVCAGHEAARAPAAVTETTGLTSRVQCFGECVREATCRSVLYNRKSYQCWLMGAWANPLQMVTSAPSGAAPVTRVFTNMTENLEVVSTCIDKQCPADATCHIDCKTKDTFCLAEPSVNADCNEKPISNVRHYPVWTSNPDNGADSGVIKQVVYEKIESDTMLRVQFHGDLTTFGDGHSYYCSRFFFTFNGVECPDGRIEHIQYMDQSRNYGRPATLDGLCSLAAGVHTVALAVGACSGYHVYNSHACYGSGCSVVISEVPVTTNAETSTCPGYSIFNTRYSVMDIHDEQDGHNIPLASIVYKKRAPETAVHVIWTGSTRHNGHNANVRYYITFNGVECQNPGPIEYIMFTAAHLDNHNYGTVAGLCRGLAAGDYTLELRLGDLSVAAGRLSGAWNILTGWNSNERFIVQEVRLDTLYSRVPAQTTLPVSSVAQYNVHSYYFMALNNGRDSGVIKTVLYNKFSDSSALKVEFQGNLRMRTQGGICYWYFTFNGIECSNPNSISGMVFEYGHYSFFEVDRGSTIEGYCSGIRSGPVMVALNVKTNTAGVDCYTGMYGGVSLLIHEVRLSAAERSSGCTVPPVSNIQTTLTDINLHQDMGLYQSWTYTKRRSTTALRVRTQLNVRAAYQATGCYRWSVRFNGAECRAPAPIDWVRYYPTVATDHHRTAPVEGICEGFPAGNISIGVYMEPCSGSYDGDDNHYGWNSNERIVVEEVVLGPTAEDCGSMPVSNIQYLTTNKFEEADFDAVFMNLTYSKQAADTALRVTFSATLGKAGNPYSCWRVTFDGAPCPSNDIDFMFNNGGTAEEHHIEALMSGVCPGFGVGPVDVAVAIVYCPGSWASYPGDSKTGYGSTSRLIVEEVLLRDANTDSAAVDMKSRGIFHKEPLWHMEYFFYHNLEAGTDNGDVWTVYYDKKADYTWLYVMFQGDMRILGMNTCARWRIVFNGGECEYPGAIETVYHNNPDWNIHRHGTVLGMCRVTAVGSVSVTLRAGPCAGKSQSDMYTGHNSYSRFIIHEVNPGMY